MISLKKCGDLSSKQLFPQAELRLKPGLLKPLLSDEQIRTKPRSLQQRGVEVRLLKNQMIAEVILLKPT
ncbi:MAG: hypothetical protein HN661_05225 [Gammaproteobacteria bacterium]|nr:hypothetical protein [Gammaproteobacteria bacterium]MBT7478904.1 hypothetical protein [Gammaproteobacteria bacterium]